jgi:DNA-binding LacI/PurR family transcriptional regulator
LAKGQQQLIGMAPFSETAIRNPYYSILLDAIQERFFDKGYTARVLEPSSDDPTIDSCVGFILPGIHLDDTRIARLAARGIPSVVVGQALKGSWVDVDNRGGILQAIQHLVRLGHQKIAHMSGSPVGQTAQARLEAYREGMRGAGLGVDEAMILDGAFTELQAYRATLEALKLGLSFTAIISASDEMATGAIQALQDSGLRVPRDVSVVGFDDLPFTAYSSPSITTVRQPIRKLGYTAADLLIELLHREPHRTVTLETELVVRGSSGPVALGSKNGVG